MTPLQISAPICMNCILHASTSIQHQCSPACSEESYVDLQVLVGQDAIMATPAMSALIRRRKLYGELTKGSAMTCTALQGPVPRICFWPAMTTFKHVKPQPSYIYTSYFDIYQATESLCCEEPEHAASNLLAYLWYQVVVHA